MLIGDKVVEF